MRKRSLFFKTVKWFMLTVLIVSVCYSFFFFTIEKDSSLKSESRYLFSYAKIINSNISKFIESKDYSGMELVLKDISRNSNIRITVINTDGTVLAETDEKVNYMENHIGRPEIQKALKGKIGDSIRYSATVKQNMLYLAIPVFDKDNKISVILRVSYYLENINNSIMSILVKLLPIIIILSLVSVLFILGINNTFKKAIKRVADVTVELSNGKFNAKLAIEKSREINELFQSFNIMVLNISKLFNGLSYEKEELDSIISSIKEGVVVLDKKGKIERSNNSFKNMLKNFNIEDKYHWEIFRNNDIYDILKFTNNEKKYYTKEIVLFDRVYLCSSSFLSLKEETVLVFSDITELSQLESIKKDFVANVSHELNTSLSAIKGFIETLLEDEKDNQKIRYLEIIKKHSERLTNIIKDLLLLSRLEERKDSEEKEEIEVKELIENILPIFNEKMHEKNLDFEMKVEDGLKITGDIFKLEQMFINLIDNAIKYTDKGKIIITSLSENGKIKIEIEDTGIGIPEKGIDRIFERFYVVDKSRSKLSGGTGLGLSIVKHIVLHRNGEIKVKSRLGKGTVFTIRL